MEQSFSEHGNFNPHSHAGSDGTVVIDSDTVLISIHTPTQGVTTIDYEKLQKMADISIHTPTQGVTFLPPLCLILHIRFQSTLPRRE